MFEAARRELAAIGQRYARPPDQRGAVVPEALDVAIATDRNLWDVAMHARQGLSISVAGRLEGLLPRDVVSPFAAALLAVPRERFVLPEDIGTSAEDMPSPLDAEGLATVSAPHAYVLTYGLLGLHEGDHLVELGTGSGYGAALASHVVGSRGRVTSIEIDPVLHARARRLHSMPDTHGLAPVMLLLGDARALAVEAVLEAARAHRRIRIAVTYAMPEPPEGLLAHLPEGGRIAAPVGGEEQTLYCWTRAGGVLHREVHGAVRYVPERR